jgi:ATP-dependent RNA helicase DDX23/PRP28
MHPTPDTQAIVFVNTKKATDHVYNLCHKMGYSVAAIHGGRPSLDSLNYII